MLLNEEIKNDEVSVLVEDTVEDEMRHIISAGMDECSWNAYTEVTGQYEEWNDTLDEDNYVDEIASVRTISGKCCVGSATKSR